MADVPLTLPDVAEIVAVPVVFPVTSPLDETDATAAFELDQDTLLPSGFPLASRGVAVSWTVCAGARMAEVGLTETEATTGAAIVTVAVPLLPAAEAVIVADPIAFPVTTPLDETDAVALFDVLHVTDTPLTVLPDASFAVAVSCSVFPG
jgi:hypothetical protein